MLNIVKSIRKSLIIILLFFCSAMLVNVTLPAVNVQAATKKEKKIKKRITKKYVKFLKKKKFKKNVDNWTGGYYEGEEGIRYAIIDIEKDGTPELVVSAGMDFSYSMVFTHKNKKIKKIKMYDNYNNKYTTKPAYNYYVFRYSPKYRCLVSYGETRSNLYYGGLEFYKIKKGKFVNYFLLSREYDFNKYGEPNDDPNYNTHTIYRKTVKGKTKIISYKKYSSYIGTLKDLKWKELKW